ncbi:MAG: hypothetical protein COV43_02190 [Deltaproteobacteria bacterium CG11_big_fil_rev_8_21_14_0_20_42_23]|nr:MAG: hypothetical protein COV43_02190 [Deltaproteobacteria bacterium CG11_big_fil_rev_8_21_14_0_20_42_23]PJC64739.1 MAG: hypothetical protein CO021_02725 [Deltaproteobacteria bacterium CG_4_9_14_0_2_um_filter_42_21]
MEKKFAIFKNFQDAEKANRENSFKLTPEERIELLEQLRKQYQELHYGTQQGFRRVFRIVKQA